MKQRYKLKDSKNKADKKTKELLDRIYGENNYVIPDNFYDHNKNDVRFEKGSDELSEEDQNVLRQLKKNYPDREWSVEKFKRFMNL